MASAFLFGRSGRYRVGWVVIVRVLPQAPGDQHVVRQRAETGGRQRVLSGKKIWEVLPPEVLGKFAAVQDVLAKMPRGTAAIYIGDDETDEGAFAVLKNQVTVRVGAAGRTRARYFLPAPPDVLRFLSRLDREFRS